MTRNLWIIAVIIFGISLGALYLSQIPVVITDDEVFAAVDDAIAETNVQVDEDEVKQAVDKSLQILERRQKNRLKYLVSAYFVLWLIFLLYALRLAQTQNRLQQRLDRLETMSPDDKGTES
jgi:CcmD family protein